MLPHHGPIVAALLDEMERFGLEHDARETIHARKMLNLDRDEAVLLDLLLRLSRRTRVLEIGTSNGYSTLWIAAAMRETGGSVVSIDREPAKHERARANLERAGLIDRVTLLAGDATEVVAGLEGPFDTIFFDGDRTSAPAQLRLLLPKLTDDALILADNVLSHPDEIAEYLAAVAALPAFVAATIPLGKGLQIAFRRG
jgi:predicted O-methyltransferase YrrM